MKKEDINQHAAKRPKLPLLANPSCPNSAKRLLHHCYWFNKRTKAQSLIFTIEIKNILISIFQEPWHAISEMKFGSSPNCELAWQLHSMWGKWTIFLNFFFDSYAILGSQHIYFRISMDRASIIRWIADIFSNNIKFSYSWKKIH